MHFKRLAGFTLIEIIVTMGLVSIVSFGAITLMLNNAKQNQTLVDSVKTGTTDYLKKEAFIQFGLDASIASDFQNFPVAASGCWGKPVPCLRVTNNYKKFTFSPVTATVASGLNLNSGFQFYTDKSGEIKTKTIESVNLTGQTITTKLKASDAYTILDVANWHEFYFTHPLCDQKSTGVCNHGDMPFVVMTKSEKDINLSFNNILAKLGKINCDPLVTDSTFKLPKNVGTENYKDMSSSLSNGYAFFKADSLLSNTTSNSVTDEQINSLKGKLLLIYDRSNISNYIVQYIEDIIRCSTSTTNIPIITNTFCNDVYNDYIQQSGQRFPLVSSPVDIQVKKEMRGSFLVKLSSIDPSNVDPQVTRLINKYIPEITNFEGLTNPVVWRNQSSVYMFPTKHFSFYRESSSDSSVINWYSGTTDGDIVQNYSNAEYCANGEAPSLAAVPISLTAYYLRDPNLPNESCNHQDAKCGLYKSTFSGFPNNVLATTRMGDPEFRVADATGPFVISRRIMRENNMLVFQYSGPYDVNTFDHLTPFDDPEYMDITGNGSQSFGSMGD